MNARRHVIVVIALFTTVAIGSTACSSSGSGTPPAGGGSTTAASIAAVRHLDPAAFQSALTQPGIALLDVRTAAEFAEGHLANAKNIDAQASDFPQKLASLDKTASYALYCHSGRRSAAAAAQMTAAGFTKVVDLAGGVTAWTAAGNQLTTG